MFAMLRSMAFLVFFLGGVVFAGGPVSKIIYAKPLFKIGNAWEEKAAKVLSVEMQNYSMKKNKPWFLLDFELDTALNSWYQNDSTGFIRSVPQQFTSDLKGDMLVVIYSLSGSEKEIKNRTLTTIHHRSNGMIDIHTEPRNLAGDLNQYDTLVFSASIFDKEGNLVYSYRGQEKSLLKAVKKIFDFPDLIQNDKRVK